MSRSRDTFWSPRALRELLRRLDAEGREQADVIREAAAEGGYVSRERIYDICGYSEDRMLRGFTRPAARISRDLRNEGLLDVGVGAILTAVYGGGVTAVGFEVPNEVVDIIGVES